MPTAHAGYTLPRGRAFGRKSRLRYPPVMLRRRNLPSMTRSVHEGRVWLRVKLAIDLAIWTGAALVAFPLRAPNRIGEMWVLIPLYALAGMSIKAIVLLAFGLPRQVWERVTIEDLLRIVGAVATGTAVLFVIGLVWYGQADLFPRTVPLIEGVVALVGMSGVRVLARLSAERRWRLSETQGSSQRGPRRVLLVGAGDAGTRIGWENPPAPRSRQGTGRVPRRQSREATAEDRRVERPGRRRGPAARGEGAAGRRGAHHDAGGGREGDASGRRGGEGRGRRLPHPPGRHTGAPRGGPAWRASGR